MGTLDLMISIVRSGVPGNRKGSGATPATPPYGKWGSCPSIQLDLPAQGLV